MTDVEVQPNGESIEQTLSVVSHILTDADFSKAVVEHNNWRTDLSQEQVALLFLASRYQWSVALLGAQTATLKRELEGLERRVVAVEDQVSNGTN